jgi:acyl dehydratase
MPYFDDIREGEEPVPLRTGPVTRQMLVEWCAAENDYYPLHYDERLAASMALPGTPIQGTFKYALMGQQVQRWLGAHGTLNRISAHYRGIDLEGEIVTARSRVLKVEPATLRATLEVWVQNDAGARSTSGEAVVTLQRRPDV